MNQRYADFTATEKARVADLCNSLWEVFHHNELDDLVEAVREKKIDGNDHPVIFDLAVNLVWRRS